VTLARDAVHHTTNYSNGVRVLKALVTGGAGFIGSNICRKLVSLGWFVRVVDNLSSGKEANLADIRDKVEFMRADMGEPAVAAAAMKDIDVVFHHGAQVSVPASVEDPATTHRNCVDATFTLLMAARQARIKRFVYAASSAAYGDDPAQPKVETMLPKPISPYAIGKLAGEYYCSVFFKVYGLETISLRYFNVFGPRQDPKSQYAAAIPAFVTMMLNNKQPTIYGDGEQTRDFPISTTSYTPISLPQRPLTPAVRLSISPQAPVLPSMRRLP
jgi:UDP-glucose 4-epimerase